MDLPFRKTRFAKGFALNDFNGNAAIANFVQLVKEFETLNGEEPNNKSQFAVTCAELMEHCNKELDSRRLLEWIGGKAAGTMSKLLWPVKDYIGGVLKLPLVEVKEFCTRKAITKDLQLLPKNFHFEVFASTFLKDPLVEIELESCSLPSDPIVALIAAIPAIDSILAHKEKVGKSMQATSLALEIAKEDYVKSPQKIKALSSAKLVGIFDALKTLPAALDDLLIYYNLLAGAKWTEEDSYKEYSQRCNEVYTLQCSLVVDMVKAIMKGLEDEVAKPIMSVMDICGKSGLLGGMIKLVGLAREKKDHSDRLGGDSAKYMGAKDEPLSDYFYAASTKILALQTQCIDPCLEIVKAIKGHRALPSDMASTITSLADAFSNDCLPMLEDTKYLLADLIATLMELCQLSR